MIATPQPQGHQVVSDIALFAVVVLGAALIVGVISSRLRIPYVVGLLIAALPARITQLDTGFSAIVLLLLLPPLVFEGAWNSSLAALVRVWRPLTLLVIGGVLASAFVVAAALSWSGQMPFASALILGAILAATDPIAVIAIFRQLNVPEDLATLVEGESLFNDGMAVVLYGIAVSLATGAMQGSALQNVGVGFVEAIEAAGVGGLIGLVIAWLFSELVARARENRIEFAVAATVVAAYSGYLVANELHVSGIFAAVVAGLSLRTFKSFTANREAIAATDTFWGVLAFAANAIVFVFLGLRVDAPRILHEPVLVLLTIAFMTLSRLAVTYGLLPFTGIGRSLGTPAWKHVIAIAGMRGALSLALALALPDNVPARAQIIDAVEGVVVVTLLVQGLTIGPVLKRLRL